VIEWIC